jgi:cellulose synthase operon protein C
MRRHWFLAAAAICLSLALSACDSSETRAEKHFQAALAHMEAGDADRAVIEFRNVFRLNGSHKQARQAYAKLQRDRGYLEEAYSQYLRLIEQYPDDLDGRLALVEMALEIGNREEAERHGLAAADLAPTDPRVQAVSATLAYQTALEANDPAGQTAARNTAEALIATHPDLILARRIVIRDLLRTTNWAQALAQTDAGLAANPDARDLYTVRLGLLQQLGDIVGVEAQLIDLVARYPDDPNMHQALVRWYIDQGDLDAAEAHLRSRIDPASKTPDAKILLIRFLTELRGAAAARAELDQMIAAGGPDLPLLRGIRTGLDFDAGKQDVAIADMEALIKGAEANQQTRNLKVALARMLLQTGDIAGARARVDEVLLENPTEVEALKLKAEWLIEEDKTGDAIAALRSGLGVAPRDPGLMTLMAQAHERDGNHELMGEMLALAADASGYTPPEALRYAAYLTANDRLLPAEDAVLAALRQQPQNIVLLTSLGDIYLRLQDWSRVDRVIETLKTFDTEDARSSADELTVQRLAGQNRTDDLLAFLEEMKRSSGAATEIAVEAAIVQSHISRGDFAAALAHVDTALKATPQDPDLRFLRAAVLATDDKFDEAEQIYRALLAEDAKTAKSEPVWTALFELTMRKSDTAEANAVLDAAVAALPNSLALNLRKAGLLEQAGDIDGAIAIYEALYARDSNKPLVANNLASLLVSHREDAASLARAELIARRLRSTQVPAFQDTYGWIAHRLGNHDEALRYLEPAAAALIDDAAVQYHLAATYAALGRNPQALAQFRVVAKMVDPANPPPFVTVLTAELARLEAEN